MNWIGAILLIMATSLIGFDRALQLKKRPEQIMQFKIALQIMEAEMMYSQQSLVDVCSAIAQQLDKPIDHFFITVKDNLISHSDLSMLWATELDQLEKKSSLIKPELNILKQFGHTLGHFDLDNQQKQIKLAIVHLDRLLIEAEERHSVFSKVYRGMGILTGILIALILL